MKHLERAIDKAVDSADEQNNSGEGLVIEGKKFNESATKTDTTGVLNRVRVIQTASGSIADTLKSEVYKKEIREKLRAGETVTVNAKKAELSAEDIAAIHEEAALSKKEGWTGTIRLADVLSAQQKELHDKLSHLGVEAITHESVYNVMSAEEAARKVELSKKDEEPAPEAAFEGMKA